MIDYETDPRPFSECLKEFAVRLNGGKTYGAKPAAARELRTSAKTIDNWMQGIHCPYEGGMRRLMTYIEAASNAP